MKGFYWVEIKGMTGDVEFDSTHARAVRGEREGLLDLDCVAEADDVEQAVLSARDRFGWSGTLESVVRIQEQVLPRIVRMARAGDTTLGRVARRGVHVDFKDVTESRDLEYEAMFQGWSWASGFVMERVEVVVWEKSRRHDVVPNSGTPWDEGEMPSWFGRGSR